MKLLRRVGAGIHPEVEMTRYLTERGFANTPPLLGEVARVDADGTAAHADAGAGLRAQPGRRLELDARLPCAAPSRSSRSPASRGASGDARRRSPAIRSSPRPSAGASANCTRALAEPTDDPGFAPERGHAADAARLGAARRRPARRWRSTSCAARRVPTRTRRRTAMADAVRSRRDGCCARPSRACAASGAARCDAHARRLPSRPGAGRAGRRLHHRLRRRAGAAAGGAAAQILARCATSPG